MTDTSDIDPDIDERVNALRGREKGRGRDATAPAQVPARGWRDVLMRTWSEMSADRLSLVAAGVTFYAVLALFPAIAAFVSLYGLFADPVTVESQLGSLKGFVPPALVEIVSAELERLSSQEGSSLGIAFVVGLLLALWSANKGVSAVFDALNVVYEEDETRGFVKRTALTLAFTVGAIVLTILLVNVMVVLPAAFKFLFRQLGLSGVGALVVAAIPVLLAVAMVGGGIALAYRYGPSRRPAKWRWISVGSVAATVLWGVASVAFSFYLANFANYGATYGSLGAVIGMMMWIWISSLVVLLGAELNAELEHQTAEDTTVGPPAPLGQRGARMADTVGEAP